jgi:hypothetical protein
MTDQQESPLQVIYCNGKHTFNVGRLILNQRKIFFEYSPNPFSILIQDLPSLFASKCHALLCRKYEI